MVFYIFSVDGNIGSGKSTLIKKLQNQITRLYNINVIYLQEPVDEWKSIKDENNKNLIENYYCDQKKWGFSFQITTLISRIALLKNLNNNRDCIILSERSIYSDKNVFCKMLHNDNIINTLNYNVYLKWFNEFIKDYPVTGYIYIKTTPEKAYERVLKRKRKEEEGVPLEYLKKCNDYHNSWLENENDVLIIDGNKDVNDDVIPDEWIQSIDIFIKKYIPNDELEFNKYFIQHHPFC